MISELTFGEINDYMNCDKHSLFLDLISKDIHEDCFGELGNAEKINF